MGMGFPRSLRRLALLSAALALAACGGDAGSDGGGALVGKRPPTLESHGGTWLNVDEALDWKTLAGNVVYLEFGFLR
jgi:ABC-type glycerol-3-phosphate transport system substrate-binding protein